MNQRVDPNHLSNSSEEAEGLDTSDETNGELGTIALINHMSVSDARNIDFVDGIDLSRGQCDGQWPSTSGGAVRNRPSDMSCHLAVHHKQQEMLTPEEKAQKMIDEADTHKARKTVVSGKPGPMEVLT